MVEVVNTHNARIFFGKHQGELYTRLPLGYLKWMRTLPMDQGGPMDLPQLVPTDPRAPGALQMGATPRQLAEAEMERRGTELPEIDVTAHAVDRASVHCFDIYMSTRAKDPKNGSEGLYTWLSRMAQEALEHDSRNKKGTYFYNGMRFAFEDGTCVPVLKTVMRIKENRKVG